MSGLQGCNLTAHDGTGNNVNGCRVKTKHRKKELKGIKRSLILKLRNLRVNKLSHLPRVAKLVVSRKTEPEPSRLESKPHVLYKNYAGY